MPFEKGFFGAQEVLIDYLSKLGDPGRYPFTRGIYENMYRGKKPTVRQFAGEGLARHTNARFKTVLALGGTGLSTAFDLPTLYGDDSDSLLSRHEVGWDGVAIDSIADMHELFRGIPMQKTNVSMTINAPAAAILAMFIGAQEDCTVPQSELSGTIQNDILKEHIAQNEFIFPVKHGMRLCTDLMEYSVRYMPKWHPVSVSGYHIREAGSSAVQEIAYTLRNGIEYADELLKRGLPAEKFLPKFSFFFDVHNDFFEEIAKLRAARRLWAEMVHERYGVPIPSKYDLKDPQIQSLWCRMHAQTAGCTLQRKQPLNNIVRVAYQALAALLGGVQSIHTNAFDEVMRVPTEKGLKLALRTQQILLEETNITNWIDPLAGSYLLEELTENIYTEAKKEIAAVDNFGGMRQAIEEAYPQRAIHENFMRDGAKEKKIVGKNIYEDAQEDETEISEIMNELSERRGYEKEQIERLNVLRKERSSSSVQKAIDLLKIAAGKPQNLIPVLIDTAKKSVTLGEIHDALREVWGEADQLPSLTSPFSRDRALELTGGYKFPKHVRVLLAKAGHDGHTVGFYALQTILKAMGAEVIHYGLRASPDAVAQAAVDEDVDILGLSAMTGDSPRFFADLTESLKSAFGEGIEIFGGGIMLPDGEKMVKEELKIKNIFISGSSDFGKIISRLKEKFENETN